MTRLHGKLGIYPYVYIRHFKIFLKLRKFLLNGTQPTWISINTSASISFAISTNLVDLFKWHAQPCIFPLHLSDCCAVTAI